MDVHKETVTVRDLTTSTVTLYPTRAHIVRTIENLSLKVISSRAKNFRTDMTQPGLSEITIFGITPTADETSIKFEGAGAAATITDMTIDLVDNRDHFEDVYPSDTEDRDSDSESSSDSDDEPQAIKDLTFQLQKLESSAKEATEKRNSAQGRLNMLDNYARSLITSRPDDIAACVNAYQDERAKAFEDHKDGEAGLKEYDQQISKMKAKKRKLQLKIEKQKAKTDRAKTKNQKKKDCELQQEIAEKKRVRQERMRFWPKKVYKVVLSLDANSGMTPASSRRGSIDSMTKAPQSSTKNAQDGSDADMSAIKLSFSYITHSASWSPRYDLALDTVSKSGSITYRAEFRNTTSETWRDAKVVLSTSQTSFQSLGEPIPRILPWHIRLAKGFGDVGNFDQALYSRHEQNPQDKVHGLFGQKPQLPRSALFGTNSGGNWGLFGAQQPVPAALPAPSGSLFGGPAQAPFSGFGSGGRNGGGLFGSSNQAPSSTGFGAASNNRPQESGAVQVQANIAEPAFGRAHVSLTDEGESDLDNNTLAPTEAALAFEESTWEESGLTATYTVPGSKTIAPSNTTRRHKIASIPLSSVSLSHIIVPKLRAAAFLKARLRNDSPTTLLRGPAGLTLDGTFLGNTSLPRSSPGEAFVLNLGVDPALNVVYSKPTVRRSESGMFQKEGSAIYTRTCTLTNTKNDATIEATVLDQVPVSEDDKLKVEILIPRGLSKEGSQAVRAGIGQINEGTGKKGSTYAEDNTSSSGGKWGKATAKMKKEGEIEWDVKLNPGQGVKLELEYEAKFPSGTGVVGV
ncbi:MAG: hypothetical protein Q9213_005449 [Squamulea squamosa]